MLRQRVFHAADCAIVLNIDRPAAPARHPVIPGAHQRMLQNRQLVRAVARLVEQAVDKTARNLGLAHPHRLLDHGAALVARHARNEEQAVGHRLGQITEARAVTDKIRAQRQHDVDWQLALSRRFQQQFDEGGRIVRALNRARKAEQFLKLVNHHQQVFARRQAGEARCLNQAKPAAPQPHLKPHRVVGVLGGTGGRLAQNLGPVQRPCQVANGVGAGPHRGGAPARAGPGEKTAGEIGQETGQHQRRLA